MLDLQVSRRQQRSATSFSSRTWGAGAPLGVAEGARLCARYRSEPYSLLSIRSWWAWRIAIRGRTYLITRRWPSACFSGKLRAGNASQHASDLYSRFTHFTLAAR